MKYTRKEKRIYVLLFSMSCFLIIFALYKNLGSSPSNGLRNLIESKDVQERCDKKSGELENEYKKDPHSFDLNITKKENYHDALRDVIEYKKYKQITKYLPRVITYLIVAIVGIIFIVFWFVFCCSACKNVGRQNNIGCGAKCCFIIFIILCLGVIFFCVIGIVYTPYLKKTFNGLACYTYKLVFDSYEGLDLEENNWIGLKNISERLNTLEEQDKNRYREGIETINSMKSTFEEINDKTIDCIEEIMDQIDKLYPYNSFVGFGGIALFNLLGLLSLFLIFVCQIKCMSCLYHIFWNIEMIFIICTFFISAVIGGFSNVSKDISEIFSYLSNSLNSTDVEKKENLSFILDFTEIQKPLNVCLNGNQDLYSYIFQDENPLDDIKDKFNCSFFEKDYKFIVYALRETVPKKLFYISLLYIIADVAGIISIFFGIMIYNSQKGYNPAADDINVNINNRMPINNRVDLSTENLKRQNNDVIFSKK